MCGKELSEGIAALTKRASHLSPRWQRAWRAFIRQRCRRVARATALRDWCIRVARAGRLLIEKATQDSRGDVMGGSLILLCTIASTSRLLREWEESVGEPLVTHTVIVDECGCTTESSVALLMRLRPQNLLMVGDHKQLPPTSMVPPQELLGMHHDRSLLERCIMASGSYHCLREQYRMHPKICNVVSTLFYNDRQVALPKSPRITHCISHSRPFLFSCHNCSAVAHILCLIFFFSPSPSPSPSTCCSSFSPPPPLFPPQQATHTSRCQGGP